MSKRSAADLATEFADNNSPKMKSAYEAAYEGYLAGAEAKEKFHKLQLQSRVEANAKLFAKNALLDGQLKAKEQESHALAARCNKFNEQVNALEREVEELRELVELLAHDNRGVNFEKALARLENRGQG